jgi:hypothetical protein
MATRRRRFSPTPRRKKVWADIEGSGATIAEDTAFSVDMLAGFITAGGSIQGATVIRTLLDFVWYPTAAVVAGDKLTIGLIHQATGALNVADPITEPYADWAYVRTLYAGGDTGLLAAGSPWVSHHDVHAMRKLDEVGTTWFLSGLYTAPGSATTANYKFRGRVLLLLP